ncbi:MAG: sugar phosphate isomerase/epimerase [Opitutaceae bacterium]|nr:sugar phosphate isomerase/epimerase [Opitutaceae bacterium]
MTLTRCFSSLGCPELSLEATLALAAKHRVPLVELRVLDGSVDLPAYFSAHFGTPERLAAYVAGAGGRIVALDASLRLVGGTETERADLAALAPWAEALDARWLRVFDGGKAMTPEETAAAVATLRWWRELRAAQGWRVNLMVETHDSLLSAAAIGRFRAAAPDAAILWDAHHTWRKGGEDPVVTWRAIHGAVVHVHVKDSIGVPSARHPFTYVLPGDGEFPAAPLLAALQADGFAGPVSLEWEKQWHPYLPSLDTALTVAAARRWW